MNVPSLIVTIFRNLGATGANPSASGMMLVAAMDSPRGHARAMKPRDDGTPRHILLTAEVAEYLHVSLATVHRLVRRGQIPAFKIGTEYRFYRDAIEKWMIDKVTKGMLTTPN